MVSFVIIAKDKAKRLAYARDFCAKEEIDRFDISLIEKDTSKTTQSIGIEDVKQIQKKLILKPMKSTTKAVIIEDAHLLTPEAQNALLKVLEEPPAHTIIILGADTTEALLPTILSRCQIIPLEEAETKLTEKERTELTTFLTELPTLSIGDRLKKAEQLAKDKEKAVMWIEKLILVLHDKLISTVILVNDGGTHPESAQTDSGRTSFARMTKELRSLQSLHAILKTTNVNPRFAIEDTLLTLSI